MDSMENDSRPGFFKHYHETVRKSITNDQFNEFARIQTDQERVKYLLTLAPVHEIEITTFFRPKSESEALEFKERGNKAFIHKNNLEALKLYSQAVVKAPVPIVENVDPKKMTLYAICLANRSAALFHLKEYYYCIRDIEEALEHHYPKELKYKLYKRKGRLLVSFKRHVDALDSFRQALKWLDWAKMERDKRIDQQNEIQRWIRLFQGAKVLKNADWEDFETLPPIPDMTENGINEKFPSLTKKVTINYEENRGRYAVAAEDIKPDDVICSEKPYASVLMYEQYGTHCQNCFTLTKAPIPCKQCAGVLFCSTKCRDEAYFHKVECPILDLLHGSGMSINCFLSLRIVTQSKLSFFMEMKEELRDEEAEKILSMNEVYKWDDFSRLYNLVKHSHKRTPEDFFHRTLMAVFLLKSLKKTRYFSDYASKMDENINDIETFVGGLIVRFLQIVQFNAHEVSEFVLSRPKSLEDSKNTTIGAAIYPSLALFNHSCQTSLIRYFSGNQVITRALIPIKKGEYVPENYGQSYTTMPKAERKVQLNQRYWFDCCCQACDENWPQFKEMDNSVMNFKCQKCEGSIQVHVNTPTPFFTCSKCNTSINIMAALKKLQNTEETFKSALREISDFNIEKAKQLLLENMRQLNNSLCPPFKDYHTTQEALMRCYLTFGNKRICINSEKQENGHK